MNKNFACIMILLLATSCAVTKRQLDVSGTYSKKGKDIMEHLKLNKDNTFILMRNSLDVKKKCEGTWIAKSKSLILLKCSSEYFPATIGTTYMAEREYNVHIINNKKIRIGKSILKRQDSPDY